MQKWETDIPRGVLVGAGAVIAICAVVLVCWLLFGGGGAPDASAPQTGQGSYKTDDEKRAELERQIPDGMFDISIASTMQFADGESAATANIENVPGNNYDMKVVLTQDDTGEVLYESDILHPNQFIERIKLARDLPAGNYVATARFTALDRTNGEEVGQSAAQVTLHVMN